MTSDGKILNSKTNEKEDMIFNFSADDDLWVYVDGNLILDIGGCHRRTSGNINFAQNQVYYESIYHLEVNTSEKDVYKTAFENGMLEPGEHTLTVFYIERSGDNANLSISFNLEQGNVETEYIDIDTNKVLSTEKQEGPLGKKVTTNAKNITGYTLVKKPESETFTIKKESQTVKYYYAKNTTVTAKYIDKITNEEILDKVTISGKSGDKYEILQKIINGYDLIKIDGNPKGTMKGEPINIIYYYKHKSKIIVNYIDKETGKLIGQKEEIYYEGDIFNPEIRNYEGFLKNICKKELSVYINESSETKGRGGPAAEDHAIEIVLNIQGASRVQGGDKDGSYLPSLCACIRSTGIFLCGERS